MSPTRLLQCAHWRTLGLDEAASHTLADVKAAFQDKAKRCHPDAGGDAQNFRQLKEAYDALRVKLQREGSRATDESRRVPTYKTEQNGSTTTREWAGSHPRSHMHEERYNVDGRSSSGSSSNGTWDYGSGRRYANASTAHFYRPYTSRYSDPSSTGFTRREVALAERAMQLNILKRLLWNCAVYGSILYLVYEYYWPVRRSTRSASTVSTTPSGVAPKEGPTVPLVPARPAVAARYCDSEAEDEKDEWAETSRGGG